MILGVRALLVQERENLKASEIRKENCFIYLRRWQKAFILCNLRKLALWWVISMINIFIFTITLPVFFFMSVDKGFKEVAARNWKGNFIESYFSFKRARNITLLATTTTIIAITLRIFFTFLFVFPEISFGSADDTLCLGSSIQACANAGYDSGKSYIAAQSAINAATRDGQIIQILPGSYHETQIQLGSNQKNIILRGNASDPSTTILRGFWDDQGLISDPQCDGFQPASCEYHGSIIIVSGGNSSTIEGVYLYKGGDDGGAHWEGGGIRVTDASPTIQNNYISYALIGGGYTFGGRYNGGGIALTNSNATVKNNTISANRVYDFGGGIYIFGNNNNAYSPAIENNTIISNSSSKRLNNIERAGGGGIYILQGKATVRGNAIASNTAAYKGGGIRCQECLNGTVIENNTVNGNTGEFGAGIYIGGGTNGNMMTIQNNVVYENSATSGVGGIHVENGNDVTILHNTLHGNTDGSASGAASLGLYGNPATAVIKNNIITSSTDRYGVTLGASVPKTNVDYNVVWNNALGNYGPGTSAASNDINVDPKYTNSANDLYTLKGNSPAVNAADTTSSASQDRNGISRPQGRIPDRGAYEYVEAIGDIYVDAFAGSDETGTGAQTSPWKTITRALGGIRSAGNQNIVHVTSGTTETAFTEQIALTSAHAGTSSANTQFVEWTDGSRTRPLLTVNGTAGFSLTNADYVTIAGFRITNATDAGISLDGSEGVTLRALFISPSQTTGIRATNSDSLLIENTVVNGGTEGVSMTNSRSSSIRSSAILRASSVALTLQGSSANANITNTIFTNSSTGKGIAVSENAKSGFSSNYNVLADLGTTGTYGSASYSTLTDWKNGTSQDANSTSESAEISVSAGGTVTIQHTSSAINAGINANAPATDYSNATRPFAGGVVDIGPVEYQFAIGAIYVDATSGNDASGNGTANAPWKTVTRALAFIRPEKGDTIYAKGTSSETIAFTSDHRGASGRPTTLTRWPNTATDFSVDRNNADGAALSIRANDVTISYVNVYNALNDGISVVGASRVTITNSIIHDNGDDGIHFSSSSSHGTIANTVVYANGSHGLRFSDSQNGASVSNTIYGNGSSGLSVTNSTGMQIQNTISSENTDFAIKLDASSKAGVTASNYNNFYSTANKVGAVDSAQFTTLARWQSSTGLDRNSLSRASEFDDTDAKNFDLLGTSPNIDAGVAGVSPAQDIRGRARPQGNAPDIGAYETVFAATNIGSIFYADGDRGADTGNCDNLSAPCKTLTYALSKMSIGQGQTLNIRGTFKESVTIQGTGTQSEDIQASAHQSDTTTIRAWDFAHAVIDGTGRSVVVAIATPLPISLDGIEIRGGDVGVEFDNDNKDSSVSNMFLHDCTTAAIRVRHAETMRLINTTITNSGIGADIEQTALDVMIANTIFVSNATHIRNAAGQAVSSDYNIFFTGEAPTQMGEHSIVADPLLKNLAGGDIELTANSPARDAGTASFAPAQDFQGQARPFGGSMVDIGADESRFPGTVASVSVSPQSTSAAVSWNAPYGSPESYSLKLGTQEDDLSIEQEVPTSRASFSSLTENTAYFFTIAAQNEYGEGAESELFTFTTSHKDTEEENVADNEEPTNPGDAENNGAVRAPTILAPTNWFTTENRTPRITGLSSSGHTVEFFIDGAWNGRATVSTHASGVGNFAYTPIIPLLPGKHIAKARTLNAEGQKSGFSNEIFFFVFSKKEAKTLNTLERDYASDPVNTTSSLQPKIIGLADPNHDVEIFIDNAKVATLTNRTTLDFVYTPQPLKRGIHSVFTREADVNGKTIHKGTAVFFRVIYGTPAPVILSPDAGKTQPPRPNVEGVVKQGYLVHLFVDGKYEQSTRGVRPDRGTEWFSFSLDYSLASGDHTLMTRSVDLAHPYKKESLNSREARVHVGSSP